MDLDERPRGRLLEALTRLGESGGRFAHGDHEKVITIGVRRWASFERRSRRRSDRQARITDLANGLYAAL